jgi:ribosome biogenesis protein MAK21
MSSSFCCFCFYPIFPPIRTGINRAHPYLPEKDKDIEEHLDTLYRVVHTAAPSASTQALMLLFHVTVGSKIEGDERNYDENAVERSKTSPNLVSRQDRFYRALYATLSSNQSILSPGKHLTMYFNLLYKAMKYDTDVTRVNAFGKRIFCSALHCSPPVLSGSLFLLNEITKGQPELKQCFTDTPGEKDSKLMLDTTKRDPRAALVYDEQSQTAGDQSSEDSPKYPPFWELSLASNHFHPSVSKFANTFGEIEYMGDPLKDFALTPFLDKFAYRNPKSSQKLSTHFKRGETVAERKSGREGTMLARMSAPVNDPSFLKQEDVNEQDEFFLKFFVERARRDEIKGIVRHKSSTDGDNDGGDDIFDEAVEAAEGALDPDSQKRVRIRNCDVVLGSLFSTLILACFV